MAKNFFKGRGTPLFLFHTKDETKKIKIRDKKLYCNQPFHCGGMGAIFIISAIDRGRVDESLPYF